MGLTVIYEGLNMSTINLVIYLLSEKVDLTSTKKRAGCGGYGYTYDISVVGKKKLAKDVPTTSGFYTNNPQSSSTVVDPISAVTLVCSDLKTELEAQLTALDKILDYVIDNEEIKNVGVICKYPILARLSSADINAIKETKKIGRVELSDEEIELVKTIQIKIGNVADRSKFIFNDVAAAEGGMGNRMAQQQSSLAVIETLWSTEKVSLISDTPIKQFLNPECDFNKIVSATRWYFSTGEESEFDEPFKGYRRYSFGRVEKDKKYYGKITPDVTYSQLYTKSNIELLDKLYNFTKRRVKNPKGLLLAGDLQFVKSKEVSRFIDSCPGVVKGKDVVLPFRVGASDEPLLIELLDPPGLSYHIIESMADIDVSLNAFLDKDENNEYGEYQYFIDITDLIYTKEANKKGVVKLKLNPDFKQNTPTIKITGRHRKAVKPVPVMLSVGYDTPERNAFNSVTDTNVEVWVNLDQSNDGCLFYRTIVKADDWIYIHSSGAANVRILNKSELGQK